MSADNQKGPGSKSDQGSAHLGGAASRQDSSTGKEAGREHEKDRQEQTSLPTQKKSDVPDALQKNATQHQAGWSNDEERNDTRRGKMEDDEDPKIKEGDRRDTAAGKASGQGKHHKTGDEDRKDKTSWSQSTGEENN